MQNYDKILKEAYIQIKSGNIKPIEEVLKIAHKKYPPAEYMLGELNESILGNKVEAIKWYKKAARHGHARAQEKYINILL